MPKISKIPRQWIFAVLSVMLVIYLVVSTVCSSSYSRGRLCTGVLITVHDTASLKFVNPQELAKELGDLPHRALSIPLSAINIDSLERALERFDKIESVAVNILSNGKLHIDVHPMRPVARIFNMADGKSFYINRSGKRIAAIARYHLDVPVVSGNFPDTPGAFPATGIISLVDFINADSTWSRFVSMIKVDSPTDIIIVPVIRGHVINIGDTLDYADKFDRLRRFYSEVSPVKGWEHYDTISLKWQGQIVAHRRGAVLAPPEIIAEDTNFEDVDVTTMIADEGVAPGQVIPGRPAKAQRPIPGATAREIPAVDTPASSPDSIKNN